MNKTNRNRYQTKRQIKLGRGSLGETSSPISGLNYQLGGQAVDEIGLGNTTLLQSWGITIQQKVQVGILLYTRTS